MCSLDLEPCEVWDERPFTARKQHTCDGCKGLIHPGEPYVRHFIVFEGEASTEKICGACWFAREEFAEAHGQSFSPSSLMTMLEECVGENDDDEDVWRPVLAGLLRRYRRSKQWRHHVANWDGWSRYRKPGRLAEGGAP